MVHIHENRFASMLDKEKFRHFPTPHVCVSVCQFRTYAYFHRLDMLTLFHKRCTDDSLEMFIKINKNFATIFGSCPSGYWSSVIFTLLRFFNIFDKQKRAIHQNVSLFYFAPYSHIKRKLFKIYNFNSNICSNQIKFEAGKKKMCEETTGTLQSSTESKSRGIESELNM